MLTQGLSADCCGAVTPPPTPGGYIILQGGGEQNSFPVLIYNPGSFLILMCAGTITSDSAGNNWQLRATDPTLNILNVYTCIGVGTGSNLTISGSSAGVSFTEVPNATTLVQAVAAATNTTTSLTVTLPASPNPDSLLIGAVFAIHPPAAAWTRPSEWMGYGDDYYSGPAGLLIATAQESGPSSPPNSPSSLWEVAAATTAILVGIVEAH